MQDVMFDQFKINENQITSAQNVIDGIVVAVAGRNRLQCGSDNLCYSTYNRHLLSSIVYRVSCTWPYLISLKLNYIAFSVYLLNIVTTIWYDVFELILNNHIFFFYIFSGVETESNIQSLDWCQFEWKCSLEYLLFLIRNTTEMVYFSTQSDAHTHRRHIQLLSINLPPPILRPNAEQDAVRLKSLFLSSKVDFNNKAYRVWPPQEF